jgi:hypothetical protein
MDKKKKKRSIDEEQSKNKSQMDDIPLWLQGLDEPEEEEPLPQDLDKNPSDSWISEIDANFPELPHEPDMLSREQEEPTDDILPGWISELSREDKESTLEQNELDAPFIPNAELDDEIQPINPLEQDNTIHEIVEDRNEEQGFIEISDIALDKKADMSPSIAGLQPSGDDELPGWLKEMVSETVEEDDSIAISAKDQGEVSLVPSKEIEERNQEEAYVVEFPKNEEPSDGDRKDIVESTEDDQDEDLDEQKETIQVENPSEPQKSEITPHIVEEDTVPVKAASRLSKPVNDQAEEPVSILPSILRKAKLALEKGNLEQSLDIINVYIEENAYLDEITKWLEDLIENQKSKDPLVWEAYGDVQLKQGKFFDAQGAYAHAAKYLLNRMKE